MAAVAEADPDVQVVTGVGAGRSPLAVTSRSWRSARKCTLVDADAEGYPRDLLGVGLFEAGDRDDRWYRFGNALAFAMCRGIRDCRDRCTFAAVKARFSNGIATMIMPWLIGRRCRSLIDIGDTFDSAEVSARHDAVVLLKSERFDALR